MYTDEELESLIADHEKRITELAERKHQMVGELRDRKSRQFIAANKITRTDVWYSIGEEVPSKVRYAGTCWDFTTWIKQQSEKRMYAEWNGEIHFVAQLMAGRFQPTPAKWGDVPA